MKLIATALLALQLLLGTPVTAAQITTLGVTSAQSCDAILATSPKERATLVIDGAPLLLQNNLVGGCTALWPSPEMSGQSLVLLIASNHPNAVTHQTIDGEVIQTNFDTPVAQRPLQYRHFAVDLDTIAPGSPIIIEQRGLFNVPVFIKSPVRYQQAEHRFLLLAGCALSLWCLAIGTSLGFFSVSRQSAFLGYALLALASGLMVASKTGFGQSMLWFAMPEMTDTFVSLSVPLAAIAIAAIMMTAVNATAIAPKSCQWLLAIVVASVLVTALRFLLDWRVLETLVQTILVAPFLAVCLIILHACFRQRPIETTLVTLAFSGLAVGVLAMNLSNLGVIQGSFLALQGGVLGAVFDFVFVWVLIGYQVYSDHQRAQRLNAENAVLRDARESELVAEVAARTASLQQASVEKTRLLHEFLAYSRFLTHDIRNPLTNIMNQSALIETHLQSDSPIVPRIRSMGGSIRRISNLFDDWLIVQRTSLGFHSVSLSRFDVQEFVTDVIDEVPFRDQVRVDFELQRVPQEVCWDRNLIKRVLHNLLENAKRYGDSPNGFQVIVASREEQVSIEVIDFGAISFATIQSRLWRRVDHSIVEMSELEGAGLGTVFVANVIRLHRGEIETRASLDGKGLRIKITIAVAPKTDD